MIKIIIVINSLPYIISNFYNLPKVLAVHRKRIWWTKMEATTAERQLNIVVDPQLISIPKVGKYWYYCKHKKTNMLA